jgi:hypothetical protein
MIRITAPAAFIRSLATKVVELMDDYVRCPGDVQAVLKLADAVRTLKYGTTPIMVPRRETSDEVKALIAFTADMC